MISTNRSRHPMPVMPAGACMVAESAEAAGHRVRFLDLMFVRDPCTAVRNAIDQSRPELVALSFRNIDSNIMQQGATGFVGDLTELVRAVRTHSGAPVILGGAALGIMPEQILRATGADCVVSGRGEAIFPLLLDRLSGSGHMADLPGVGHLAEGRFRLTPSPPAENPLSPGPPDFGRWLDVTAYRRHGATTPIQTRTGCRFRCIYCSYPLIEGDCCRFADAREVADTVMELGAAGQRDVEIVDSVFNAPADHAMRVCEELSRKPHKARLQCLEFTPLDLDGALIGCLRRAGFVGIGISAESAGDRVLAGLQKGFGSREVHRAAEALRRYDIPCLWMFLLGGPGETHDTVRETLRFAEKHVRAQDVVCFTVGLRIYPGTALESIARQQGVLTLPADRMLEPAFYLSPELDQFRLEEEMKRCLAARMNFIGMGMTEHTWLPAINRWAKLLGIRPPMWRYTRTIRRGLRMSGMEA